MVTSADVDYIHKGMTSKETSEDVLGNSYKDSIAKSEKPMAKVYKIWLYIFKIKWKCLF